MKLRSHLTRLWSPAAWALRAHWVTSALLAAIVGTALVALLLVSLLLFGSQPGLRPRLVPPVVPMPDLQLPTSALMTTPADVRGAATDQLFQVLLLVAAGVFLVAALSVVAVAAARGAARASELIVRRAVGASRRLL